MSIEALTSADISLPARPDAGLVRSRIAILAQHVDLVSLTENHAGQPRMSPLAAVALAREQGVATVVHVSCRDRNRLALRSEVLGAAALGCDGVLCLYGDRVPEVPRVRDYTTTRLLAKAKSWVEPYQLALGCVVDPYPVDCERYAKGDAARERAWLRRRYGPGGWVEAELALLGRKIAAGADFAQTHMVWDPDHLPWFLELAAEAGKLGDCRIHASVPLILTGALADLLDRTFPFRLPRRAYHRITAGGGIDLAIETAIALAEGKQVHALHVMAWGPDEPSGWEEAAGKVAAAFRTARGALVPVKRQPIGPTSPAGLPLASGRSA